MNLKLKYEGKMKEDLCIKIHEDMKKDFKVVCDAKGVTRACVIRNAIKDYIDTFVAAESEGGSDE